MKILFIYYHKYEDQWKDGLSAALDVLRERGHDIRKLNLFDASPSTEIPDCDFILGWGGFNSPADMFIQTLNGKTPQGLCLAGNAIPLTNQHYNVIFYETQWHLAWLNTLAKQQNTDYVHAFGTNTNIYKKTLNTANSQIIDYLTVGAFAKWKRQDLMLRKSGCRMAVGEIQKDNLSESMGIIAPLMTDGVIVADMMEPTKLAQFYNASKTVYIPADVYGGGERAVLEARACGCKVAIEPDNPKLAELQLSPIWDEKYYADQLEKGIQDVLKSI